MSAIVPTILAIETSSELASCALLRGGVLTRRASNGVRTHSQSILPMVQELLAEAGIALADCDAIAYGAGPGSFTGVRTATGVAQGLAFGAKLPVVAVVTLAAMAHSAGEAAGATEVLAALDARMGEVYWGRYRKEGLAWIEIDAPALAAPEAVPAPGSATACGNAYSAYPQMAGADAALADIMPDAGAVAQLAALEFAAGRVLAAAQAQPLYLRNKIAFTSAERKVINAEKAAALVNGEPAR
jgi:tRNA threonylcarbamoyladenosine biosynthesis protein TsaB